MAVYFVQAGEGGPVKIGFSENVAGRLVDISVHCPAEPMVLGIMDGTATEEAELHLRFAVHRIRGEWFSPHPDILALAASCEQMPPRKRRRFTSGRNKLADYLEAHSLSIDTFAAQIGRSSATVSRIARGKNRPDWPTMDAVARVTNGAVMPSDFDHTAPARAPKGHVAA